MKLSIFLLTCYRDTATKQHFVKAVKKGIYSSCEDGVVESIWDLIELIPAYILEEMFETLKRKIYYRGIDE